MNTPAISRLEALSYSKKIITRGDGYFAVNRYLERQHISAEDTAYILEQLHTLEKNGQLSPQESSLKEPFDANKILGLIFVFGGIALSILLWNRGLVGTLPFALIAIGIYALFTKKQTLINRK